MPSKRGRRFCAASCEIARRNFSAKSAGAFFRPRLPSSCCVRSAAAYSRAQESHCSTWCVTKRISAPLTRPSIYGENKFLTLEQFRSACFVSNFLSPHLVSEHFMVFPQPVCHWREFSRAVSLALSRGLFRATCTALKPC